MTYYTIYKTTHLESGKIYIGKHQTLDPDDEYMGSGHKIRNAVKKHGLSAFKKEVLHVFETESEMNAKEIELVTEEFCLRENTYNLCPGGQGGWGYILSNRIAIDKLAELRENPEFRALHSKKVSEGLKLKYSNGHSPWSGKNHSEETKSKIKEKNKVAQLGDKNSQFGTMWITNGNQNAKIKKAGVIPEGWYKGRSNLSS